MRSMPALLLAAACLLALAPPERSAAEEAGRPREFGTVHWLRALSDAEERATKEGKPMLVLFQEVPG